MIKPLAWLTLSVLLSACAQMPRFASVPCLAPVSQSALLSVQKTAPEADGPEVGKPSVDKKSADKKTAHTKIQRLVLYTRQQDHKVAFVGVDTIGSPLFSATLQAGKLSVNTQPLYRGVNPELLLWGYLWWQGREHLRASCATASGYQLTQQPQQLRLWRAGKLQWQWRGQQARTFVLAPQKLQVKVRVLEQP